LGTGERAVMFPAARHARALCEQTSKRKRGSPYFVPPERKGEAYSLDINKEKTASI
jgi:hypothetical protein